MREKRDTLRIHSRLAHSRANGPGERAVIWLQGCPFRCQGCFNQGLRDTEGGKEIDAGELFRWFVSLKSISGITLSGGEPTEQIHGLLSLLTETKIGRAHV